MKKLNWLHMAPGPRFAHAWSMLSEAEQPGLKAEESAQTVHLSPNSPSHFSPSRPRLLLSNVEKKEKKGRREKKPRKAAASRSNSATFG